MVYNIGFGVLALLLSGAAYVALEQVLGWPYYFVWVLAVSTVTLGFYGLDKGLAKAQRVDVRVPELILNLLTVSGGSLGAWLGRWIWRHKIRFREHWVMFLILVLSTLLHAWVLHTLYNTP